MEEEVNLKSRFSRYMAEYFLMKFVKNRLGIDLNVCFDELIIKTDKSEYDKSYLAHFSGDLYISKGELQRIIFDKEKNHG